MADHSLQLRLAQKMALSPQLQQAIRLLQLTRIELREYLQDTLDANPLLEQVEPGSESGETEEDWGQDESADDAGPDESLEFDYEGDTDDWSAETTAAEPWGEGEAYGSVFEPEYADREENTLRDHLRFQINLAHFSETDTAIAEAIVFALDEDGFLADDVDDIRASLAPEWLVQADEVLAVLHRIQRMEPVGVASRDPAECIRVQLSVLPSATPGLELARRIARDYLDLLADHDLDRLADETGAARETLREALDLIQSLEPRPGARYDNRQDEYLVPDVYVRQVEGKWVTYLSPDNDPRLRLNKYYIQLLRQSGGEDRKYLQGRLQEARWLLSSLELRNRTLLNVSQCIIEEQEGFLEQGEIAMKPLILKDVAERVGVHESTVSRATTRKYMLTPRGLFELKYFFSSHVRTLDGGEISATAVKARIQRLVEAESTSKPLSDERLSRLLRDEGIRVARRTVAKYRESLGIGSSSERRKLYRRLGTARESR